MKLTFKKDKRDTGLRAIAHPYTATTIKHNKKQIGTILPPNYQKDEWQIQIAVKRSPTEEDPGKFKWIYPKVQFGTESQARNYIKIYLEKLLTKHKFELHHFEDD